MTPLEQFLVLYFSTASALAFFLTVYDKLAAKHFPRYRIAERSLLALGAIGGAPVMLVTMALIRHKTQHFGMIAFLSIFSVFYLGACLGYLLFLR